MNESTIEEIKDRLNVADVISSYIPIKKAGTNYKATCPFHNDTSPSLMISPSKQIWHCFGCGAGGNVFGFVMQYENIDFPECIQILAAKAGVQLPKFTKQNSAQAEEYQKLERMHDLAAKFYNQILDRSSVASAARAYIEQRGLTRDTVRDWQIGFAPGDFHTLELFLQKKGFSEKDLLAAGLSSKSDRGIFDRFVNRITFPIRNYAGATIGFTARTLDPDSKVAKYINSPETAIYRKGKVIFGLNQAKQEIRKLDCAIIVEGNMDVISCHQAGFKNVVGSSGTAFTIDQLTLLARLTKNLKFAFDTDEAGIIATRRALDLALTQGFNVYIVKIVGAKDPDEMIKRDRQSFVSAIAGAQLYMDYFFEKTFENYDPSSVTQKKAISQSLVPLIEQLHDPLELAHYVRLLSQRLGVSEKVIHELFTKNAIKKIPESEAPPASVGIGAITPILKSRSEFLEEKVIGYGLFNQKFRDTVISQLRTGDFRDPQYGGIFDSLPSASTFTSIDEFISSLKNLTELAKLALFMIESEYSIAQDDEAFAKEFNQILKEFKTNSAKLEMSTLVNQMVQAEQQKNKPKLEQLNKKFLDLSKTLNDNTP